MTKLIVRLEKRNGSNYNSACLIYDVLRNSGTDPKRFEYDVEKNEVEFSFEEGARILEASELKERLEEIPEISIGEINLFKRK